MNLLGVLLTRSVTDEGGFLYSFLAADGVEEHKHDEEEQDGQLVQEVSGQQVERDQDQGGQGEDARNERELATDKGIKSKAWHMLVAALNRMHKRKLSKDQYKSKFVRLMHDYDLYKSFCSLTGAGMGSDTPPTLDDDVWEHLMASKP
ncbi:Myb/SANT-like DNA-binding domain [Phytophthora infestans]|uniref:Myb/SANT-like DNA-binding domain n=1 Tax=Phytophthora infestans TaxID=4787 RepID=A0A833RQX8_PHYIN|nr:Myb/SANT-like DNA-binding domain [Phytophthora infestans]